MVYLIHFQTKLHHAEHYLGFVEHNLPQRLKKHKAGTGAKLLAALNRAGIAWDVVRVWKDGDRHFERQLKNRKKSRCLCPVCRVKH